MTERIRPPQPTDSPARRQLDHALTALAATTPGRRRYIAAQAERYLAQVERRQRPAGYRRDYHNDVMNRRDAFEIRGGATVAVMLGLSIRPSDPQFPGIARAIVTAVNAPVDQLVEAAHTTGAPAAIALVHILGGTR
ncbi:hypothetical protein [Streptomyces sp. NPDC051577]|uniref:hypothetical protein n=1 Tax=Streptomyces sp. NPDC051577 TaxID=3155166 RepID=UPI003445B132